jgi:outer membrane lipoprotein
MCKLFMIILSTAMMLHGCTTFISEQSRRLVDTKATFAEVRQSPDSYIGKHIMLGGRIAGVKNTPEGSQIEVVQFDLTWSGYPEDKFVSYGRFLATSTEFLDTMIFRKGMLITMVGEIKGKTKQRLDEMEYIYPVIAMREWYLWRDSDWEKSSYFPSPSPPYDPYNYGYGFEPYWFRPISPPYRQER